MQNIVLIIIITCVLQLSCSRKNQVNPDLSAAMPKRILWAWERPEDLNFLDPKEFGVAYLSQTLFLENDHVMPKPRHQPLEMAPETYLIAVTRIETNKDTAKRPEFTPELAQKVASMVALSVNSPLVRAVQVDFDAVSSEREFYRQMMTELRKQLPAETPLTMTALASWCTGDAWFNKFPVDEAVPMAFQMGADSEKIRTFLRNGNDWKEPLCRGSYGISLKEGRLDGMKPGRRTYFFSDAPWRPSDISASLK